MRDLSVLEICAGAGGQSLGLENAGFAQVGAVEIDRDACETLSFNRPRWKVLREDIRELDGRQFRGVDLFAGGVPCPPFSLAGRQLGASDQRDLFPAALRLIGEVRPTTVMLENVRGIAMSRFATYREQLLEGLQRLGYLARWQILNACEYGVPQLRPRFVLVAFRKGMGRDFVWPAPIGSPPTVGESLKDLMASKGWTGAFGWAARADGIAPTIVGGSIKHGGPDLGPTRARAEWLRLGVDGLGIANDPPSHADDGSYIPKLTLRMAARLQGFPDHWTFIGRKTSAYRQIGNAFPPPVAAAVGEAIRVALTGHGSVQLRLPA